MWTAQFFTEKYWQQQFNEHGHCKSPYTFNSPKETLTLVVPAGLHGKTSLLPVLFSGAVCPLLLHISSAIRACFEHKYGIQTQGGER